MYSFRNVLRRGGLLWQNRASFSTQGILSVGSSLVSEAFTPLFQRVVSHDIQVGLEIRHDIIQEAYQRAVKDRDAPSRVFQLITAIPSDLTLDRKLDTLAMQLKKYPLMPVITSHPTYPLSISAMIALCDIVDGLLLLERKKDSSPRGRAKLIQSIHSFSEGRLVPETNLTPNDESDFALFLYKRILSAFPDFHHQLVTQFQAVHGGEYDVISERLKDAVMESFRHVFSWSKADFDGNKRRTRKTLESTVPSQQCAILELYLLRLQSILKQLDRKEHLLERSALQEMRAYFKRCMEAIKSGIWFDVSGSEKTKKRTLLTLDTVARSFLEREDATESNEALAKQLLALRDLIDLGGFFGGLKEYTRQTTQLNQRILHDLLSLLVSEFPNIRSLMGGRIYAALDVSERQQLLKALRQHPRYFEYLKKNADKFGEETKEELAKLAFILEHRDIFPSYIFSDTEGKINLDEVSVLFYFSSYLSGNLRIGQIQQYPVNPLVLCETPKDIRNFSKTLDDIFKDPAVRERLAKSYFFSYVGGPSDLGKKGGIFVYIALLRAQLDASKALETYQKADPRLALVKLLVLHGFGGDGKRRDGSAGLQAHSTQQHFDALRNLGATGAYLAFLHRVAGHPSESYFRAEELKQLAINHPDALHALAFIESICIQQYERLIQSPENKALLSHLTSFELERALNVSSRAGSKAPLNDPTNVRAIGVVNLYLLSGIQWDIFMSMEGVLRVPPSILSHLPFLFDELTVMRDIAYKVWFSIAASDFQDAWLCVNEGVRPSDAQIEEWAELYASGPMPEDQILHCMLAHIEVTARRLLTHSVLFFPEHERERAEAYLNDENTRALPVNEAALGVMDRLGVDTKRLAEETRSLLPYFERLRTCVKAYEENPSEQNKENAVLACRGGGWIVTGPAMIAEQISPLHQQAILGHDASSVVLQDEGLKAFM